MKEAEGKKKVSVKDKKHHDHNVPSYLKDQAVAVLKAAEQKPKAK